MIATLLELVPQHGASVLFLATLMSCLALPIPTSLLMLAAGAFIATGDLQVWPVAIAAFCGAVTGDQIGYGLGRFGGHRLWERLYRPNTARLMDRAEAALHARALSSVFFSRWLFSALGPWINLAAGTTEVGWRKFSAAGILGEAVWVGLYIGLGYLFADRVTELGSTMGSVIGALTAGLVAFLLGRTLWNLQRD